MGVALPAARTQRTPVTTIMPVDGERAMVTFDPGARVTPADVAALAPRAVVTGCDQLALVPPGARAYVSCGDDEARRYAGRPPDDLRARPHAARQPQRGQRLTGEADPEAAAGRLAELAESVVLTLGPDGALAVVEGRLLRADGVDVGPVVDTTGAATCSRPPGRGRTPSDWTRGTAALGRALRRAVGHRADGRGRRRRPRAPDRGGNAARPARAAGEERTDMSIRIAAVAVLAAPAAACGATPGGSAKKTPTAERAARADVAKAARCR